MELGAAITTASTASEALNCLTAHLRSGRDRLQNAPHERHRADHAAAQTISGLPVVLISGFVDSLGLSEDNTGADVVIQKSNNEVAHLVRAVSRLLRRKKTRASQKRHPPSAAPPAPR